MVHGQSNPAWRKSTYSESSSGSECVEVAVSGDVVLVRDSKRARQPRLGFPPGAWADFVVFTAQTRKRGRE
ncbi:DUF397 domain-containing protein [Streptomyces uncialis]|uniref:DUF397 domain-containing protein n=1 Tax=Streptomyces uncialis TaxID=1048205 RepID=UPI002E3019A5|nr:DUF397 domain-containing protein [Streptomyces uncialis]WST69992.1 DUF397 domain-containing protein [Streptomyces uncialis]